MKDYIIKKRCACCGKVVCKSTSGDYAYKVNGKFCCSYACYNKLYNKLHKREISLTDKLLKRVKDYNEKTEQKRVNSITKIKANVKVFCDKVGDKKCVL